MSEAGWKTDRMMNIYRNIKGGNKTEKLKLTGAISLLEFKKPGDREPLGFPKKIAKEG